jgi:hypothetical protein
MRKPAKRGTKEFLGRRNQDYEKNSSINIIIMYTPVLGQPGLDRQSYLFQWPSRDQLIRTGLLVTFGDGVIRFFPLLEKSNPENKRRYLPLIIRILFNHNFLRRR